MNETTNIYRVRKSALDIKSQVGAFFILEVAIKVAIKNKCNVYNNKLKSVWNYNEYKKAQ